MPIRRVVTAFVHPFEGRSRRPMDYAPPRRVLWVETLEGRGHLGHEVFEVAPLLRDFRELISKQGDLEIKDVRLEREGRIEALIMRPSERSLQAWHTLPIGPRNAAFTRRTLLSDASDYWLGMTREVFWVSAERPAERRDLPDVPCLGRYVNIVSGLDEYGTRIPRRHVRQGPIPEEDKETLGNLAP